jgi:tetrahydromethanopterin S-methyltransferase subunit G
MAEAWIYSRQGLTAPDGRSYSFTEIALKVNNNLIAFQTYADDYTREEKVTPADPEYAERIIKMVEQFKQPEEWLPELDLATKTGVSIEKVNKILALSREIESLEEQLDQIAQKIKEAKSELYHVIEEIRREAGSKTVGLFL